MTSKLFSGTKHALLYSKFRPLPPSEFIDSIIKRVKIQFGSTLNQALDIGCGSGQSTIFLSPHFKKVIGCDISEPQINCAKMERSAHNIEYRVADCEKISLPDSSCQLVTCSQAIHWFDTSKIFNEVKRILIPDGTIAICGYWIPFPKTDNNEKNKKLMNLIDEELHEKQLGKYWNAERYIVKNYYRDIIFPFKNVQRMDLSKHSQSTLADYIGYLSTWSAYQKFHKEESEKAEALLKNIEKEILRILDSNKTPEEITFSLQTDFFMLMGNA